MRSSGAVDMTRGPIARQLISFAAPMLVGLIFQQMYNTVDSIVVGNYVSSQALAAVGSTGALINTLLGFFSGFSSGATVIIARAFGARDNKAVHDAVHTTILMTLILSIATTVVGTLLVPTFLRMMKTPEDVFPDAVAYLRIYFLGVAGLMFYNMGAGILRAVGDSRRPLYFLIFSAVVNTIGDLIFVLGFGMGVEGVAYATILAQALSALLVILLLMRSDGPFRLFPRHLRIHMYSLKGIIKIGLPFALQAAVTNFSNMFVQTYINGFGSACAAGWSIYGKLDQFALLPLHAINVANSTFVGQNLGACDISRAKQGIRTALRISFGCTVVLLIPVMLFAKPLLTLFNQDPNVLYYGRLFVLFVSPFYLFCCVNDVFASALRAAGESVAVMASCLGTFVVARQIYLFIASRLTDSLIVIALGYPFGWVMCCLALTLCYIFIPWEKKQRKLQKTAA